MTPPFPLTPVNSHPHIHRLLPKNQLTRLLKQELRQKHVTSAQWFRVADLYLRLNHGNISPLNIGVVHAELCHLQKNARTLSDFCRRRLFVFFGVGVGDTEMAIADLVVQRQGHWEGILIDSNPAFLRMFVCSLANRSLENRGYTFNYLAIQNLFENTTKTTISPENTRYHQKVFVCLGSTIGNFDNGAQIFAMFSALANVGDRLVVGYQTDKYLPVIFEKYRQHTSYRTLIGNFLPASERPKIEWRLNTQTSTVEAWYNSTQLFRSKKFHPKEVASRAHKHGWEQKFLSRDPFGNICLHGFTKLGNQR